MKYQFDVRLEILFELTIQEFELIDQAIKNNPESVFESEHGQWWYGQTNSFKWYHEQARAPSIIKEEPHFTTGTFRQIDKHIMKSLERLGQQLLFGLEEDKVKAGICIKLFAKFMTLLRLANDRYAEISKTSQIKEI